MLVYCSSAHYFFQKHEIIKTNNITRDMCNNFNHALNCLDKIKAHVSSNCVSVTVFVEKKKKGSSKEKHLAYTVTLPPSLPSSPFTYTITSS